MRIVLLLVSCLACAANAELLRVPGKAAQGAKATVVERFVGAPATPAERIELAPFDAATAKTLSQGAGDEKASRVGWHRDVWRKSVLVWWPGMSGGWVARLRVRSPEANALRVGIAPRAMPPGTTLRVQGASGPVIAADAGTLGEVLREDGTWWTAITEGDEQLLEFATDAASAPAPLRVNVESVSHLAGGFKAGGIGAAQGCHEDVQCVASFNPALARAARSVAKLAYTKSGATYLCTGTLVNDGSSGQVPYVLTAAHCIDSQAVAATVNSFWFFEASACGAKGASRYVQLGGGATLLYADAGTDVALLRLADRVPDGAWFAGWDATPLVVGSSMVGMHHPMGDLKKLSTGDVVASLDPAYVGAAWRTGTTEPGSSGSGLFTEFGGEYLLRGGLRGGSASCTSSGNLADPANRDSYSRLDIAMPALRKWMSGAPAPIADFTGLWYDAEEPGWGISITQTAGGHAFVTWYTYDDAGHPQWFVAPEVQWTSAVAFEAPLHATTGTGWSSRYEASRFQVRRVGTLRMTFGVDTAAVELVVDGLAISKPLRRLAF